jgi:peptide/nickel transport system permease protein
MRGRFVFIPKRIALAVPLLIGVVFLVFLILQLTPGDPARQVVGLRATEEQVAEVRAELGLNDPPFVQFVRYLGNVAVGNFGYSFKSQQPVLEIIGERLPVSLWLIGFGAVLSVLISVAVANAASRRPGGIFDHATRVTGVLFFAMPSFWVGILLIRLVALPTGWFPVGGFGYTTPEHLRSIILPAITLALAIAPLQIRSLRASLLQVRQSEFVTTARSLGIPPGRTTSRFILRNAMGPTVSILALNIGYMLFGAVVIETTFGLPGIGEGIVLASRQRDIPLIQGYTILFALIVVLVYLVADIVTAILDPRLKVES